MDDLIHQGKLLYWGYQLLVGRADRERGGDGAGDQCLPATGGAAAL